MNPLKKVILKQKIKREIKWIIWDFDGTLWQSDTLGIKIKSEFIKLLSTHMGKPISEANFDQLTQPDSSWGQTVSHLTQIPEMEVINQVESYFDKTKYIKPNPGMVKFVTQFTTQQHLVLTDSSTQQLTQGLKKIGFKSQNNFHIYPFNKLITRETYNLLKPNKQIFSKIYQFTKTPKFNHLVIGDSYSKDLKPAINFGFQALHINDIKSIYEK